MNLHQKITQLAKKTGFPLVSVIPTDRYECGYNRLATIQKNLGEYPFVKNDPDYRTTPNKYTTWAKSLIIGLYPYGCAPEKTSPKPNDQFIRGRFARVAWGRDYHLVVKEALVDLAQKLKKHSIISSNFLPIVDTSPLAERELAFRGELGIKGNHNCLMVPGLGSFFFIGGLLIDTELPQMNNLNLTTSKCLNCERCINSCPGSALDSKSYLDLNNCAAYLTVKKGFLTRKQRNIIGDYLYGCDKCQVVCPENRNNDDYSPDCMPEWGEEVLNIDDIYPKISDILKLSNKQFKNRFKDNAIFWRGKKVLQRNALIVLGNLKDPRSTQLVLDSFHDQREIIRTMSVWASEKIYENLNNKEREQVLKELNVLYNNEKSEMVLNELKQTLNNIS
ncbi:tRNA epoxyqueuosine(34) reductase QueG [Natranaerobius trueperi]|uniref:tRNA epoxyqueuosine(34) reductase QueG n=1 Tax=Natranaerobius trueperi TaxID=759412 RepID=A0A226C0E6_9FIRM|nr:tRNA epoxyqueuosine(34) reductase QueG [Natranaerobius trueperi]OWZ84706.1 tRNA epoxyqueuosine(34) reductase QueG [Natranaerobius trueperi]